MATPLYYFFPAPAHALTLGNYRRLQKLKVCRRSGTLGTGAELITNRLLQSGSSFANLCVTRRV